MWTRLRYRPAQAALVAALAAIVTACTALAPLYLSAMSEAYAAMRLQERGGVDGTVQISAPGAARLSGSEVGTGSQPLRLMRTEILDDRVLALLERPVSGLSVPDDEALAGQSTTGHVRWRQGFCDHVRILSGRCPARSGEVLVSRADATNFDLASGARVAVTEPVGAAVREGPGHLDLVVVGVYDEVPGPWWFGTSGLGQSGKPTEAGSQVLLHDDWLTPATTFTGPTRQRVSVPTATVDFRVDPDLAGRDELLWLGDEMRRLVTDLEPTGYDVAVVSGLSDIADEVRRSDSQSQLIVPLLVVQLALVGLVVLVLVLAAAVEQRRPELALVRLRGHGRDGARRYLVGELLPAVLLGVPVGAVLAVLLAWLARTVVLPGPALFHVPAIFLAMVALAAVVLTLAVVAVAHHASRTAVVALLRRTPVRRTSWRLGTGELVAVAVAAALALAFVTGGITGPVGLVTPALLALAAGLVLAHLVGPVGSRIGHRLLLSRRLGSGLGVLHAARRPGTRQLVAVVAVGIALLVFAVDAVAVGARNRELAAEQELGAPVRATLVEGDLTALRRVLDRVDPSGTRLTPYAQVGAGSGALVTFGVDPRAYRKLAFLDGLPRAGTALRSLRPSHVAPVRFRGDRLSVTATRDSKFRFAIGYVPDDGNPVSVTLNERRKDTLGAAVGCSRGCTLTSVGVESSEGSRPLPTGEIPLGVLRAGGRRIDLGEPADWHAPDTDQGGSLSLSRDGFGGYLVTSVNQQLATSLQTDHNWWAARLPVVMTSPEDDETYEPLMTTLTGAYWPVDVRTEVARLPGLPHSALLVDLDRLTRIGARPTGSVEIGVLGSAAGASLMPEVRRRLRGQGVNLAQVTTLPQARGVLDRSVAAWSLDLGALIGVGALLLCALALLVVLATTRPGRARDRAALMLTGVPGATADRAGAVEQAPVVVLGGLVGALSGLLGAHFALPGVPMLAFEPDVSALDLHPAWGVALLAVVSALAVLLLIGAASSRRFGRPSGESPAQEER